jgi:transketolase
VSPRIAPSRAGIASPPSEFTAELRKIARELCRRVVRLAAPTGQGYVQQGLGAD